MQPKTQKTEEWESTFNILADKWEKETAIYSLMAQMAQHYAYQLILGHGRGCYPAHHAPDRGGQGGLWYHALETITGIQSPAGKTKVKTEGWYS